MAQASLNILRDKPKSRFVESNGLNTEHDFSVVFFENEKKYSVVQSSSIQLRNNKPHVKSTGKFYLVSIIRTGSEEKCKAAAIKLEAILQTTTDNQSSECDEEPIHRPSSIIFI
jgi:hypothetical protein